MSDPGRRPSLVDVAAHAKVSRATASRALSGGGPVAPAVRARVLASAEAIGYVPNAAARSLKQQTSRTIGVLVSDLTNPFYAEMAAGAGAAARVAGYTMLLTDDAGSTEAETRACEAFISHPVAGVIATPVSPEPVRYLSRFRVPVVEVDRQFSDGRCDAVVVDNRSGARRVTEHLLALGHRRIALLIDETDWTTGRERYLGYRDALITAGVPLDESQVVPSGWSTSRAVEAARALLTRSDRPTAVFAANNVLAEGTFRACADLGIAVPDEVSLASFDDAPWMTMVRPAVTAVVQDAVALGRVAMERLVSRIEEPDGPPRTVVLPAVLTPRGSTSAVRSEHSA